MRRLVLPAALLAIALAAANSSAAPPVDITDPSGDAVAGQAAYDVVSVDYAIVKKKTLAVTMKLAGAPAVSPGTSYQLGAETGCGHLFVFSYYSAGEVAHSWQFSGCGGADPTAADGEANLTLEPDVVLGKDTITWSVPVKSMPAEVGLKAGFSELTAYTAVTEPAIGYTTADFVPESAIDYATGDRAKF